MSDEDANATLSDTERDHGATPAGNGEGEAPRDTVEGDGLDDEDDLFGDGEVDDEAPAARKLDDEELDSGDDEGRADGARAPEALEDEGEQHTFAVMDADIARHAIPEPSDGELYLLKVPRFLSFEPAAFSHKTFQPPTTDHHSKVTASDQFSAYNTAMSTIRWRRSPSNNAELQSNARILRWADGSLTLQIANDPTMQFDIDANTLAPPQVNPKIPTPTSIKAGAKPSAKLESYTYLVAPYEEANVMRVTNKLTTALSVVPAANLKDTALEKLQNDLAQIASRGRDEADQAISFVDVHEDPELHRQREEATFKERQRQARAREKHEARQAERAVRTVRSGGRSSGLNIDDLEDAASRPRKPRQKGGLRRDWSDDEDFGRGPGRSREDDYDEEDDFIAASDEEPEIVEDDDDPDEGIAASPKRRGGRDNDGDNDDVVVSRTKRRRVVDDDEDDE
ncbi:Paf1 complex component [Pleosporales sp. CAS-2024a]